MTATSRSTVGRYLVGNDPLACSQPGYYLVTSDKRRIFLAYDVYDAAHKLDRAIDSHAPNDMHWWVDYLVSPGTCVDGRPSWLNLDVQERLLSVYEACAA